MEKYNSHRYNQEHGQIWNSSEKPPLCFPFDVSSPMYFECPTLERRCLRSCSRTKHLFQFIWGPSGPSPNARSSKANRLWFGFSCFFCFSVMFVSWGYAWWTFRPEARLLMDLLLEVQGHSGPRRLEGLEAVLARLVQACNITGVTCGSLSQLWNIVNSQKLL